MFVCLFVFPPASECYQIKTAQEFVQKSFPISQLEDISTWVSALSVSRRVFFYYPGVLVHITVFWFQSETAAGSRTCGVSGACRTYDSCLTAERAAACFHFSSSSTRWDSCEGGGGGGGDFQLMATHRFLHSQFCRLWCCCAFFLLRDAERLHRDLCV